MRQPKGTVTVENFRGRLRLRLPRQVFGGEKHYLSLHLSDTPENRKVAEARAKLIERDIALDNFDQSLERYRPPAYAPTSRDLGELPTLSELWQQYSDFKAGQVAQTTMDRDFKRINNHIAKLPTQDICNAKQIRNYLQENLMPDAARRVMMFFSACCTWAVEEEIIPINPFEGLKIRTKHLKQKEVNPFTKEERDAIIRAFETDSKHSFYAPFVKFLFLTGCRTSEAVGLQWQHIDKGLTTITFSEVVVDGLRQNTTKTKKSRRFPINGQLREVLLSVRPTPLLLDSAVFTNPQGSLIDAHNFLNRAWKGVFSQLIGIPYRPQYNTRHSFITYCLESGVPVAQVAAWVGNSPKTIWSHYAGIVNLVEVPQI